MSLAGPSQEEREREENQRGEHNQYEHGKDQHNNLRTNAAIKITQSSESKIDTIIQGMNMWE